MSLQQTNTSFPTHYLQIKLATTDGDSAGNVKPNQGSHSSENVSSNSNLLKEVRHPSGLETATRTTSCRANERRLDGSCQTGPPSTCVASTVINITPSNNTAPVSSGSNSFFVQQQQQTGKDFLSEEAKQAAANLRDTMAAIADRRVMFFSECPKSPASPQHSLNKSGESSNNNNNSNNNVSGAQQSSLLRSSLLLERNKDNHNFEVTSRDDFQAADPLVRERPHFVSERTMSGYYFPNLARKSGGNGRMSLKTAELLKNCPPLELYTTAPITASTLTPALVSPPKVLSSSTHLISPPSSKCQSSQPVQVGEPASISLSAAAESCRLRSSPENFSKPSAASSTAAGRSERTEERSSERLTGHRPVERNHRASELSGGEKTIMRGGSSGQNGEHVYNYGVADSFPLPALPDRFKLRPDLEVKDVCFYSAPEAFSFQENENNTTEGLHRNIKTEKKSGDSPPSTPNSGSLSSSMKSASINKLKAFFSDSCNLPGSDSGKHTEMIVLESGIDPAQLGKKSSAHESNVVISRLDKSSFKNRKSVTKSQQQQLQQQQGSPVSKHKKSPVEKPAEPQGHKETWKGRVAKTIRRYGSGSILLSSDIVPSPPVTEENKSEESGVFGVPLECCEVSQTYDLVPLIVEACVKIVEEKGVDNQGIYRVPGNTGAIKELQDDINKDPKGMCMYSEKWQDVNLVTSLLKLFFRKLPDSLITDRLYEAVIATTRLEKSEKRMLKLKRILHDMPERNFNTFAFLSKHLRFVASHEESNKMDAHNLAIMFGPTLIRPRDNNIAVMARNMADQCRVVETIILHCDWFFSSWDEDVNVPMDGESEELTPIIDEKMVAKAQSLGATCQKSSSASSLHHVAPSPSSSSKFPHASSLASLPTSSSSAGRNLESVVQSVIRAANKKWKFGGRDQHQHVSISSPIAREVHHHRTGESRESDILRTGSGKEAGVVKLKNSSSDISLPTIRFDVPSSPPSGPFSPASKKGIFTRMTTRGKAEKPPLIPLSDNPAGKFKCFLNDEDDTLQKSLSVDENVRFGGQDEGGPRVPVEEIELKIDIVRHNMYDFDRATGQFFGMADNREFQKLPWEDRERKASRDDPSPVPTVDPAKPVEKQRTN